MIALRVALAVVSILLALLLVNPAINDAAAHDPDEDGSVVLSWLGIVLISGIMWACMYGAVFGW